MSYKTFCALRHKCNLSGGASELWVNSTAKSALNGYISVHIKHEHVFLYHPCLWVKWDEVKGGRRGNNEGVSKGLIERSVRQRPR